MTSDFPLSVMDHSPHPVILFDETWHYRYLNDAAARSLGRTVDDLRGRVIWEEFPQSVGGPFWEQLTRTLAGEVVPPVESYYGPLGKWYRVEAFRWAAGVAVFFVDVTDAHRAAELLRAREEQLARAQRIARVGSWSWDADTDAIRWSDETYRIFGVPTDTTPSFDLLARSMSPEDFATQQRMIAEAFAGQRPYDFTIGVLHPERGPVEVHILGEVQYDDAGRPRGIVGTAQDVTLVRRTEQALRESRQLLARTQRVAGIAAWRVRLRTGETEFEPENYHLWQLDPADGPLTAERLSTMVVPEDRDALREALLGAIREGERAVEVPIGVVDGAGRSRRFRIVAEIDSDAAGTPSEVRGLTIDQTALAKAEAERRAFDAQLQQAQRLESLGILAGGIAHDFNNLLVGILGNASLALSEPDATGLVREALQDIEHAAHRAADLTRQLLAYSGKGRFVVEKVDLSRLLEEMAALVGASISKKAALHLTLARDLPPVEADVTQLRQVMMNLLTNASEALPDGAGTIVIRTGVQRVDAEYIRHAHDGDQLTPGRYAFFEVSDTGTGIAPDTIPRIFEPFYTTKFTGRGLGLAATLGIVRGHQGGLNVYSEVGHGTTIKVLLPIADGTAEAAPAAHAPPRVSGGTVLIVDDEPQVRRVLRAMLVKRGFDVLEAPDGEAALATFAEAAGRIRLVLLDLMMPRLDGEQVFRQPRMIDPTVRVLMMSGYNEQNVTQKFVGKGLAGFVQKPFRADDLYAKIEGVLADPPVG